MPVRSRSRHDFSHGRSDELVNQTRAQLHVSRVEIGDGARRVDDGVEEQFSPAREGYVGVVPDRAASAGAVAGDKVPCLVGGCRVVRSKGPDAEVVEEFVLDNARGALCGAAHADSRQDSVDWEGVHEGQLDVEAVLEKQDGRVAGRNCGTEQVRDGSARDVWDVLGGADDVVKGGGVGVCCVWDSREDFGRSEADNLAVIDGVDGEARLLDCIVVGAQDGRNGGSTAILEIEGGHGSDAAATYEENPSLVHGWFKLYVCVYRISSNAGVFCCDSLEAEDDPGPSYQDLK